MIKTYRNAGVSLLEVMLLLAIAGMVIVMSIRYHQAGDNSRMTNEVMSSIQSITAAADSLASGSGSYAVSVTQSSIATIVGSGMTTPIGTTITVQGQTRTRYEVTIPLNNKLCPPAAAKLSGSTNIESPTCSGGILTYTYDSSL